MTKFKPHPLKLLLRNDSSRPTDEVEAMLRWVLDRPQVDLSHPVAVRVLDASVKHRGHYKGSAYRYPPKWAGPGRWAMRLQVSPDDWEGYGCPRVCWHSTAARKWRGSTAEFLIHLANRYREGDTKFGRWPIYIVHDWREVFIHLAAHEARHLVQFDRRRKISEVDCEEWAAFMLEEWRANPSPLPPSNLAGFCYTETNMREEVKTMATATKQRRQATASARSAEKAVKLSGNRLANDLMAAVQERAAGAKLKTVSKQTKRDMKSVKVANGDATVAHLDVYAHRVRVFVRHNGEYARYTVADQGDITKAAAAIASKVK